MLSLAVRFPLRLLVLLLPSMLAAAPFTGFRDGESFTYKVGFAIFSHAGEIAITAKNQADVDRDLVLVTTDTQSRGFVRGLYEFDNHAEVRIDRATGRLVSVAEKGADPKHATDSETTFDYAKRVGHYLDRARPERTTDFDIPAGDPLDLISALVQTRDWEIKPGEKRDVLVHFGRDLYELTITAEGYESVTTPMGKYRTLVLVPRMEKNPKGLFKKGGEIKVWISQDATRLPVKMQLVLKFGTATLSLMEYKAGAAAPVAAAK
ncbi:MAG TPA: DUF3108 domain-containing protein [Candidatus Didemnitutus sp.]|nr:DUF3108 domain-containing protein [Candidatus Didemnitutus sp.]